MPAAASMANPAAAAASNSPGAAATKQDRAIAGLFSGLAVGGVALFAIGGASEHKGTISLLAVALLTVGPVAYGGLVFSMNQVAALLSSVKDPKGPAAVAAGLADPSRSSVATHAGGSAGASGEARASGTVSTGGPVAGEGKAKATEKAMAAVPAEDKREPTAYDLIMDVFDSIPSFARIQQRVPELIHATPGALGQIPGGCRSLWQWLNEPHWRPFPWRYLPNPVAFVWSVIEIFFIAPILGLEILITVPTMELVKAELRQERFAWLRNGWPELVRSVSRPLGRLMMRDPRNHSYLPWWFLLGTFVPALFFWALRRHAAYGLEFSTLCIYHLLRVGPRLQLFAHAHVLTHKEGHAHKGFFKGIFSVLNCVSEWWIGPFYGVVPWSYYIAHMKIHHRWHNDVDDVHTNLDLDRTNPLSFFLYVPRFTLYWTGLSPLALLVKRQEWSLVGKLVYGMAAYYGVALVLLFWDPVFCFVYWLFPHMEGAVLLSAISYLWHAFVEESDPGNQYVNSVTILDGRDNIWNEDYHVVHHHHPNAHWTDAPAHFEQHRDQYAKVKATIFQNTEEGQLLQWLFEQNWDMMAKHFVDLDDELTHEEKKSLIIRRLSVVVGEAGRDGKRKEWGASSSIRDFES
mmetsp:Transcript_70914/g.178783  ORF Transcript_70914/g.178783 Transcript_70914/m.178783 type:complete len:631 (-) Transcript_70914:119-2011(-)